MKKFVDWLAALFKDENGKTSSKRFIGIIAGLMLCLTMYQNSFSEAHIVPAESLINAVAALAFGCLGLASVDKIFGKNGKQSE